MFVRIATMHARVWLVVHHRFHHDFFPFYSNIEDSGFCLLFGSVNVVLRHLQPNAAYMPFPFAAEAYVRTIPLTPSS